MAFDGMSERWAAYEYFAPYRDARHLVSPPIVSDSEWSIDWPEHPDSILALFTYRDWNDRRPIDLSGATATVRLSGDVDMAGGYLRFWLLRDGTRWHLDERIPLGETVALTLSPDGNWLRTYTPPCDDAMPLAQALEAVDSYGFAFVGFEHEVIGTLVLEELVFD